MQPRIAGAAATGLAGTPASVKGCRRNGCRNPRRTLSPLRAVRDGGGVRCRWRAPSSSFSIGLYIYQYVTRGVFWRATFEAQVSKRAGRAVKVAGPFELYLDPDIRFRADGLSVANPDWAEGDQFFTARSIRLDISLWQALFGDLTINDLVVDGGRLALQRRADKANTWTFGGDALEIPDIVRAAVTDSRIALIDAPTATRLDLVFGDIAGTVDKAGRRIAGPLTFTGTGTTRKAPFSIEGKLTTPNEAVAGGRLGVDIAGSIARTRVTLAGTLPGATRIDGADLTCDGGGPQPAGAGACCSVSRCRRRGPISSPPI